MRSFPAVENRSGGLADIAEAVRGLDRPVVFRGAVADWPLVRAGATADGLIDYLKARDNGRPAPTFRQAEGDGRFFYGEGGGDPDLGSFNFQRAHIPLAVSLERLRSLAEGPTSEHVYIQSALLKDHLPQVMAENVLPGIEADPRLWLGNASVTQLHFDLYDNLVCMVAGRKRFVLLPPDQIGNLYVGPFETTLSGVPTAMVDVDRPDFDRHPRFAAALDVASEAVLEPGDVLYIPYMWWHHVVSEDRLNAQVNFWWNAAGPDIGQAMQALILAIVNLRDLPPHQRSPWKAMFEALVFSGARADHLPADKRGMLGDMTAEQRAAIRREIGKSLAED